MVALLLLGWLVSVAAGGGEGAARSLQASASTDAAWQKVAQTAIANGFCAQTNDFSQITQAPNDNPQKWVDAHNYYRACHGTPPVIWDETLASYAKAWADVVASHCNGVMDVGNFVKSSGLEPHDPESYNQMPSNAENLAVFETPAMNIVQFDEVTTVESWYREIDSQCPQKGLVPGCGSITNHFTAVVWKNIYKIGCYSALRGSFMVVSCRYASAAPTGVGTQGCDNPGGGAQCAAFGPPEPQVPALVNGAKCASHGSLPGLQNGPGIDLPSGGKMVPVGVVLWEWLKQKFNGKDGQEAAPGAPQPATGQFVANPQMVGGLKQMLDNTAQFGRTAVDNVRKSMQGTQAGQVTRLYSLQEPQFLSYTNNVTPFVILISLAVLTGFVVVAARRATGAFTVSEPQFRGETHDDGQALLEPVFLDLE